MKKNTILSTTIPAVTIGLDVSDRTLRFCEVNASGEIVAEGQLRLDRPTLRRYFAAHAAGARVALETGGHSAWVRELIEEMGHEAVVANARDLEAVTGRSHRTDRHDARQLARLARVDAALLHPVELRRTAEQADLFVIRARAVLVEARTMLINFARGVTKTLGHRLPSSATHLFAERARAAVPEPLQPALLPLLDVLDEIAAQIEEYDAKIEALAERRYPETRWLKQAPGVGTLTALTFVLTVGDAERFAHSRDVGPFLGLVPRRRQSGEQDPHLRITKCGDRYVRKLLVQCAHVVMGRFGPDCALRRWALDHARGSRTAKKRTVVAVARKLAVLLHRLWRRREVFQPFAPVVAA
jgi:transposase